MRRNRLWLVKIVSCALFLAGTVSLAQTTAADKPATPKKTSSSKTATHKTSTRKRRSRKTAVSSKKRGQQAIDPKRAQEIQEALIREH